MLYYTYLTGGDTRALYYPEGKNLFKLLLNDTENWRYFFQPGKNFDENLVSNPYNFGYYFQEGNFMVIRATALISFVTFAQYTLISLFFGCFAFSGLWKLFMFFYEKKPEMHRAFAISVLFFPSVLFWSSGLLKDSLCMGAFGWFTYSMDRWIRGKSMFKNSIIIAVSGYLIIIIKMYILLAYAPFLFLFLYLNKLKAIKATFIKIIATLIVIFGIVAVFSFTYDNYEEEMGDYAVENLTSSITNLNEVISVRTAEQGAESNFSLGAEFDGSLSGIVKLAPLATVATFFRPFIWETRKISQLMAAVESLILMFFTLKLFLRSGPFKVFKYILSDQMTMFCLGFAVIFGIFVGVSTLNFGSLVRYKIPCMPFYTIALFLINQRATEAAKRKKERTKIQAATISELNLAI